MSYVHPPDKQLYYQQVWSLVREIPIGRVATYGQLTKMLSRPENVSCDDYQVSASRWVGLAMAACPSDVPWHRVVNSQGKLSHRSEAATQKHLLENEGVLFIKEQLDLNEYQWLVAEKSDKPKQGELF